MTYEQMMDSVKEEAILAPLALPDLIIPKNLLELDDDKGNLYDYLIESNLLLHFIGLERKIAFMIESDYGKSAAPFIYLPYPNEKEKEAVVNVAKESVFSKEFSKYLIFLERVAGLYYDKCCNYFLKAVKDRDFEQYLYFSHYAEELRRFVKDKKNIELFGKNAVWIEIKKYLNAIAKEKELFLSKEDDEGVGGNKQMLNANERYLYEFFTPKTFLAGYLQDGEFSELASLWSLYAFFYDYMPESDVAPIQNSELEVLLLEMNLEQSKAFVEFKDSLQSAIDKFRQSAPPIRSYEDIETIFKEFAAFMAKERSIIVENVLEERFLVLVLTNFLLETLKEKVLQSEEREEEEVKKEESSGEQIVIGDIDA